MQRSRQTITTAYSKPGEFVGISAIMSASPYHNNAVATEETEVILIPRQDILDIMKDESPVGRNIIDILSKSLKQRDQQLVRLAYDSARKRVADGLLYLSERFLDDGNSKQGLRINRTDLANLCGITKESVVRILSDFKEEGLVATTNSKIKLLKPEKLQQMLN